MLVAIKILAGVAFAAFGVAALLAVWDAAGRFYPLHGFPQNMGLVFGALAWGFLAGYLQMKD